MRKQKGFSLIELLIVVAIILIIAAIAIPNLMRSKQAANQAAAASNVRTIISAQTTFSTTFPAVGYAGGLAQLGPGAAACGTPAPANGCMVDFSLGCAAGAPGAYCTKDNYQYAITGLPVGGPQYNDYVVYTTPVNATAGLTDYCATGGDGVVRWRASVAAPPSPIINAAANCTALPAL